MRKRLIGSSMSAVLAISAMVGPAMAAPPGNDSGYDIQSNGDFVLPGVDVQGDVNVGYWLGGQGPTDPPEDIGVGFYFDQGYQCSLDTNTTNPALAEYSLNGEELTIAFQDVKADCDDVWELVEVTVYLDTSRYRSHTNSTGSQCRKVGQQDQTADVGVTLRVKDLGYVVDGRRNNVASYDYGRYRCHMTGTPGNPNNKNKN